MGELGLRGARRGRQWKRTTVSDQTAHRPADLVERRFSASAPNQLWVADLTYVKTHAGWVSVGFIIDVFSRVVVGWQTSTSLRSDLALDALEMAIHRRKEAGLDGLIHHSDPGGQTSPFATPSDWPRPERLLRWEAVGIPTTVRILLQRVSSWNARRHRCY